jgi:hypothetical protein
MQRDANMLVPDAQQPPADQDNDRGDIAVTEIPAQRMKNIFDRPDASTMEEASSLFMMAWRHRNAVASMTCTVCLGACLFQLPRQVKQ